MKMRSFNGRESSKSLGTRYTPRPGTPPRDQVHPPGTRYTPWDQVHLPGPGTPPRPGTPPSRYTPPVPGTPSLGPGTPSPGPGTPSPGPGTPPPQSMLGDTVNARAVRILLECILVFCFVIPCKESTQY